MANKIFSKIENAKSLLVCFGLLILGLLIVIGLMGNLVVFGKVSKKPDGSAIKAKVTIGGKTKETSGDGKFYFWVVFGKPSIKVEANNHESATGILNGKKIFFKQDYSLSLTPLATVQAINNMSCADSWNYIHPDDQKRFGSVDGYLTLCSSSKDNKNQLSEGEDLASWNHIVTRKRYQNVKIVIEKHKEEDQPYNESLWYLQNVDGYWHFFSHMMTKQDEHRILKEAQNSKITYNDIDKNSSKYLGRAIKWSGTAFQVQEYEDSTSFNVNYNDGFDNFMAAYLGKTNINKGDRITIWGYLDSMYSYKSQANYNLTVPFIRALKVKKG